MPDAFRKLLEGNEIWVDDIHKSAPELFGEISEGQSPEFLWIGCADSRVPAEKITNSLPGSIFVHRNIANLVVPTDYNLLSVVYFAVITLKVKHIIICGHYGCGGIQAAMGNESFSLLDQWISHIKEIYHHHYQELEKYSDPLERENAFVDINVKEQVKNTAKLAFIQNQWKVSEFPYIHGWVFRVKDGVLKNLNVSLNSTQSLHKVFKYR